MGCRMKMLLRCRGLRPLIGKNFFFKPNVTCEDSSKNVFVSIDLVAGWQRKERCLGREQCYWVLQRWKVNMLERSYEKK